MEKTTTNLYTCILCHEKGQVMWDQKVDKYCQRYSIGQNNKICISCVNGKFVYGNVCMVCFTPFGSRNELFDHLKVSNHFGDCIDPKCDKQCLKRVPYKPRSKGTYQMWMDYD